MKYSYTCQKCKEKQVYQPRKKIPNDPHTKCPRCKYENHFSEDDLEPINGEPSPKQKIISHSQGFISSRGEGANPTLPQMEILDKMIERYSWEDILKLAIFRIPPFEKVDASLLSFYERQGFFRRDLEEETDIRYIYQDPEWAYPHQLEMKSYMRKGSCMFWGMRQLTGKTTIVLEHIYETLYLNPGLQIIHISPSEKLSIELLNKINIDPLLYNVWKNQAKTLLRESKTLMNGASLLLRPCKISSVQGLTGGLWIDELDKILLEKEKTSAFAAILPIVIKLLIEGKAFIWITCNQATGQAALAFEYLKTIIMKFGSMFRVIEIKEPDGRVHRQRYLEVLNEFDPKIPTDPFLKEQWFIDFIYELQKALMGEEFAAAQMKNIYLDISGIWTKQDVLAAFQAYDETKIPAWDHVEASVEALDPGAVHGTGMVVVLKDMDTQDLWVVVAKKMYGTQHSEAEILAEVVKLYDEWNVDKGVSETNSGGWLWVKDLNDKGYNFYSANFGQGQEATGMVSSGGKTVERQWKEKVLKFYLENRKIHIIKNQELLREFSLYNPYENKEKGKGDIMDALLHGVFECAGGVEFALKIGEEEIKEKERKVAYTL